VSDHNPRAIGPGGIVLIVLTVIVLGLMALRQNRTAGLGQTIRFDDFDFTVEDASVLSESQAPTAARGPATDITDYRLRMRVDNRAKRVPFTFSGRSFAFVDLTGKHPMMRPLAELSPSGERVPLASRTLQAGESATVDYIYSLPSDRENLRLKILSSGPVGDLLEWLIFGSKQFRLP
jgi:hypothetical protein